MGDKQIVIDKDKVDAWTGSMNAVFGAQLPPQVVTWIVVAALLLIVIGVVWFAGVRAGRQRGHA